MLLYAPPPPPAGRHELQIEFYVSVVEMKSKAIQFFSAYSRMRGNRHNYIIDNNKLYNSN